jgi:hypothetical protein
VVHAVSSSQADLGVVPVENSTEGMINRTLDMMASTRLNVIQEFLLPIRNCLLSAVPRERSRRVFSHPQALAQGRMWLSSTIPAAQLIETPSPSEAAVYARSTKTPLRWRPAMAAEIYACRSAENINDLRENITRFWVISRSSLPVKGRAKTSVIVTIENRPGALYNALGVFARKGVKLTKIESSRPRRAMGIHLLHRLPGQPRREARRGGPGRAQVLPQGPCRPGVLPGGEDPAVKNPEPCPWVAGIPAYVPGRSKEEIARAYGVRPPIVKLASNENPLGPSPRALEAMREAMRESHLYPDPEAGSLREAAAGFLGCPPANVIAGNGSDEIIDLVCRAYLRPGDSVVNRSAPSATTPSSEGLRGRHQARAQRGHAIDPDDIAAKAVPGTGWSSSPTQQPHGSCMEKTRSWVSFAGSLRTACS